MNDQPASANRVIGVLLAAGRGRRMGRTKQLVPWPTDHGVLPLVAAAYDSLACGCDTMIVIVGHDAQRVIAALADRRVIAVSAEPDAPMFESVRQGICAARDIDSTAVILLQPADQPQVEAATLHMLVAQHALDPHRAIVPAFRGKGGHPVLIPPGLVASILDWPGEGGLRAFWQANPDACVRMPVRDSSVLLDIDTPEDLRTGGDDPRPASA